MSATIATGRILARAQKGVKQDVTAMFRGASDQITGILNRYRDVNGVIPRRYERAVLNEAGPLILHLFVGFDNRSPFGEHGVTPLAPFPTILNRWYLVVTASVLTTSYRSMRSMLPDRLHDWLKLARRPVAELLNAQAAGQVISSYQSMHTWEDDNGYILSDRIWRAGTRTREKVEAILSEGIRRGDSAVRISRRLEQFLIPDRAAIRTNKPYGSDGSYDAMRLARTELTTAFGQTTLLSARLNPFVTGIEWRTSGSHPKTDECDSKAAGSPYPLGNVPDYPSHPHCLCLLIQLLTSTPEEVIDLLNGWFEEGQEPPITVVNWDLILLLILGDYLYNLLKNTILSQAA